MQTIIHSAMPRKGRIIRRPRHFGYWHTRYLQHHVVTVPLNPLFPGGEKKPAVANYLKMGARATSKLATQPQFVNAQAYGFRTGRPSGVTIMDVDIANEKIFADRCAKH